MTYFTLVKNIMSDFTLLTFYEVKRFSKILPNQLK